MSDEQVAVSGEEQVVDEVIVDDQSSGKLVPVAEAKRYRKRAQAAEKILDDLKQELEESRSQIAAQAEALSDLKQAQRVDEALIDAGAIDLDATRLLTELSLAEDGETEVEEAVRDLQRRKPFLFQSLRGGGSGVLGPRSEGAAQETRLHDAAEEASESGRRQDLLRYLRLRRKR